MRETLQETKKRLTNIRDLIKPDSNKSDHHRLLNLESAVREIIDLLTEACEEE